MAVDKSIVLSAELFGRLKPIFGLPDKVLSMSIELAAGPRPVELNLSMLISRDQSEALVEVLREFRLEKKEAEPCPPEN